VLLDNRDLGHLGKNFDLEVRRFGYTAISLPVTWGKEVDTGIDLSSETINIGIENPNAVEASPAVDRLEGDLSRDSRFLVKDPQTLEALRETIKQEAAELAKSPIQMGIRTSLGVDLIVIVSYSKS